MSVFPPALFVSLRRFYRYLFTGGAAAIVDIGGFTLFLNGGIEVAEAAIMSFCVALLVNYFLSARFAFEREVNARNFFLFAAFAGGGLLINVGITLIAFGILEKAIVSKLIGIAVAFLFNFAINSLVVFK